MKYHRFCSSAVSPYTNRRYGIFVSVWHLIRDGKVTADEEAAYWEHRRWYEAHLPVPPYYEAGNPRKAITWFKESYHLNSYIVGRHGFCWDPPCPDLERKLIR